MNVEDCKGFFQRNIVGPRVRQMIFSSDDNQDMFLTVRDKIPKYYSTMLNLAFCYVYSRYREWRDDGNDVPSNSKMNFRRMIHTLDELYHTYDLTFDVIESVLTDIHLDSSMSDDIRELLKLKYDIKLNNGFSKCAYKARRYRRTSRVVEKISTSEQRDEMMDFFKSFPFLRYLRLELIDVDNAFVVDSNSGEIIPYPDFKKVYFVYHDEYLTDEAETLDAHWQLVNICDVYYYLDHMDVIGSPDGHDRALHLYYTSIGDYESSKLIIVENDCSGPNGEVITLCGEGFVDEMYSAITSGLISLEDNISTFKDVHLINYKYVKNLALAVSDVLNKDIKLVLLNTYRYTHKDVFSNKSADELEWDDVIALLLIRENANNVLKLIFKENSDCIEKLLKNLAVRFGPDRINSEAMKEMIEDRQKHVEKINRFFYGSNGLNYECGVTLDKLRADTSEIASRIIIDTLSKVSMTNTQKNDFRCNFPVDMRRRVLFIKDLRTASIGIDVKTQALVSIVMSTLQNLICFYEGILSYAEVKRQFNDESYYRCLSEAQVRDYQKNAEVAFEESVNRIRSDLNGPQYGTVDSLISWLEVLCSRCINAVGEQTHEGVLLKEVLGRNYVLSLEKINPLRACDELSKTDVTGLREFENILDIVERVFGYLSQGNMHSDAHIFSIYPYVGTYEYSSYGKDGFNTARFTINAEYNRVLNIQVLSEFDYTIGERYYCLPNLSMSSDSLWVDPLLIKADIFEQKVGDGDDDC